VAGDVPTLPTNSNFIELFSKPNSYHGATVDLTGKVSNFP